MGICRRSAAVLASTVVVVGAGTAPAAARSSVEDPPELTWEECGTAPAGTAAGVECATADLPMDYDEPDDERVQVAVARVPATDTAQRIGSLFFNFGGPGGQAVNYLQRAGAGRFATLNERFDIIGFDPRGVGQSTPAVDCRVDDETEGLYPRPAPVPIDLDEDAVLANAQDYVDACLANNGQILEHLSTANVARDMDQLRAAVDDEQLSYLGYSYGTFLGATYAALFPEGYRTLVLDGPVDPVTWIDDPVSGSTAQAAAFERALDRFTAACAADQTACSGFGGSDPLLAFDKLLAAAADEPIPAPGYTDDPRPVTADDIRDVTATLLYAKQAWSLLAAALAGAEAGDATLLRAILHQIVFPPDDAGSDRFFTIAASEQQWPEDVDAYLERGAEEWAAFPHFWGTFAYAEIPFALWPIEDEDAYDGPFDIDPSSPTPLVIGTTYDPATPYAGALTTVEHLGNARLLTMEGDGHTAYGGNSPCVDEATEEYLLTATLPDPGTVCMQEVPFEPPSPAQAGATRGAERLADRVLLGLP